MEPVTEVLRARAHQPGGLESMLMLSLIVHGAMGALIVLAAPAWRGAQDVERTVMTISLGGAPGPASGGMTPISARPIQEVMEQPRVPVSNRPPAAAAPEMTVPASRAAARPQPRVSTTAQGTRGRTPTTGAQVQPGTARADTGAIGAGFGLSTGGGGGTGGYLDVGDFCCPDYLVTMQQLIRRNWNEKQPVGGEAIVKFTILRDGTITDVDLEQSSGFADLDLESQRALLITRRLPALPAPFPDSQLTVHLRFEYQR
jgi:TonB family protein